MHRTLLLLLCVGVTIPLLALCQPGDGALESAQHVSAQELFVRSHYRYGWYWGGAPFMSYIQYETVFFTCLATCTPTNCSSAIIITTGSSTNVNATATLCALWFMQDTASDPTVDGTGTCTCTKLSESLRYCESYTCDQVVSADADGANTDDCNRKYHSGCIIHKTQNCDCLTPSSSGDYCQHYTCLGYGAGPVKTIDWNCNVPASEVYSRSTVPAPVPDHDFCWQFQSDEHSSANEETKDCYCQSDGGGYCAKWTCQQMTMPVWPWFCPLIASPLGLGLLLVLVPLFAFSPWTKFRLGVCLGWIVFTYSLVIFIGGLVSTVVHTGVIVFVFLGYHLRKGFKWKVSCVLSEAVMTI